MNQGNPRAGGHDGDNGAFHDGGLLLLFPTRTVGLFLAFQSQEVPTDANGGPAPGAQSLADLLGKGGGGATTGQAYLERALINPVGSDGGHEVVVVGNLGTGPLDLAGWKLRDTNGHTTTLSGTVEGGGSLLVHLDGRGAQLGNNGGNLLLLDKTGGQVHAVTYAAADAATEDRFVRLPLSRPGAAADADAGVASIAGTQALGGGQGHGHAHDPRHRRRTACPPARPSG